MWKVFMSPISLHFLNLYDFSDVDCDRGECNQCQHLIFDLSLSKAMLFSLDRYKIFSVGVYKAIYTLVD